VILGRGRTPPSDAAMRSDSGVEELLPPDLTGTDCRAQDLDDFSHHRHLRALDSLFLAGPNRESLT